MTTISTPCISVCQLHPKLQQCLGCWRTKQQIEEWLFYTEAERLEIIEELEITQAELGRNIL